MPSSMPSPARRIGTTRGRGLAIARPVVRVTGVSISTCSVRTFRVASYASRVTSSSVSWRNTGEVVFLSRRTESLWVMRGWSAT